MAEIGDFGFVEFLVDDAAGLVRVVTSRSRAQAPSFGAG
jgi:hypothetical protein